MLQWHYRGLLIATLHANIQHTSSQNTETSDTQQCNESQFLDAYLCLLYNYFTNRSPGYYPHLRYYISSVSSLKLLLYIQHRNYCLRASNLHAQLYCTKVEVKSAAIIIHFRVLPYMHILEGLSMSIIEGKTPQRLFVSIQSSKD